MIEQKYINFLIEQVDNGTFILTEYGVHCLYIKCKDCKMIKEGSGCLMCLDDSYNELFGALKPIYPENFI